MNIIDRICRLIDAHEAIDMLCSEVCGIGTDDDDTLKIWVEDQET